MLSNENNLCPSQSDMCRLVGDCPSQSDMCGLVGDND